MRNHYSGDPYWLTARYAGRCSGCGKPFAKGSRVFRYKSGKMYAEDCGCGISESESFEELAAQEYAYSR